MKVIKRFTIVFILLLISLSLFPQTGGHQILLHGVVMEGSAHTSLSNVHFLNSSGEAGVTDENGQFAFWITTGDTIRFTMVGFAPATYIIPDSLRAKEYVAGIFLYQDTISAGEVVINPRMGNLRSEILNYEPSTKDEIINARNNISVSVYQGLSGANELGDPLANYELLRHKQKIEAYERGGIPSDRIAGLNPFTFLPGLIYLIANGLPSQYEAPKPRITNIDIETIKRLHNQYLEKEITEKK